MDSKCKGIFWIGNLYQKFEAMCVEVDDIMCQEATKYVETQVQSVGVSVKKLYAELMEDFLPPSSQDPEKPKEGIDENPIESPLVEELEKVAPDGKNLSHGSSLKLFSNTSHLAPSSEEPEKPKEGTNENAIEESPQVKELGKVAPDRKILSCGSSFRVFPNTSHLPPSSEEPEKPKEGTNENAVEKSPQVKELGKVAPDRKILSRGSSFRVFPNTSHLAPSSEEPDKPKEGANESTIDESPQVKELGKVAIEKSPQVKELGKGVPNGKILSRGSSFRVLPNISHLPPAAEDPIKGTGADLVIEPNENSSMSSGKLKFGFEEFTVEDKLSSPMVLEAIAPSGNDFSGASLLTGLHDEINDRACNMTTTVSTLTSADVAQCGSTQRAGKIRNELLDVTDCISDVSSASSASLVLPASLFENEAGIRQTPSGSIPLIELNDDSRTYRTISSMCANGKENYSVCAELNAILPLPDNGTSDGYNVEEMAGSNGAARSDEETMDAYHRVKLEESCVLVDIDELHFVSQRTVKNRSYKKKLRDAFASRMRTGKKQEYERLTLLCEDIDTGTNNQRPGRSQISTLTRVLDSKKSPTRDFYDSEWEIL